MLFSVQGTMVMVRTWVVPDIPFHVFPVIASSCFLVCKHVFLDDQLLIVFYSCSSFPLAPFDLALRATKFPYQIGLI